MKLFSNIFKPRFSPRKIRPESVVIIEPNPWHGEIISGFVKYFQDLGFNVDVFIRAENYAEKPFVKFPSSNLRVFICTPEQLKKWCRKLDKYEHVFLSTSVFWDCGFRGLFQDWLGFEIKCRGRVMMVEHSPQVFLDEYNMRPYADRIFALSEYENVRQCNPCYFGDIEISRTPHKPVQFAIVGTIHPDAKNHNLLIDTARHLINSGHNDFHIFIIGRGQLKIPNDIAPHITICGRLAYDKMFQTVSGCDFIIALLDSENPEHARYRQGTTTGSLQLSLGFGRPLIISESFASAYALNNTNAIVYPENDLESAMVSAINMSDTQYKDMVENLIQKRETIYQKSINNIQDVINKKSE